MLTFRSGSEPSVKCATRACPASWYATTSRSFGIHEPGAGGAEQDLVQRLLEVRRRNFLPVAPRCGQSRLVDEVREIGAGKTGGAARDRAQIDLGRERQTPRVDIENGFAARPVRKTDDDLAVKASRPQQRGVKDVRPVRGRHDDDFLVCLEAIHFHEHLVQRLLALVVGSTQPGESLSPDCVKLIDEHDRRRVLLGLVEEIADAAGADADEHLHELGGRNTEEGNTSFTGHRPRHEGLTSARRSDQEDAPRQAGAKLVVLGRIAQEVHDLGQFLLRLVLARHVSEGHLWPLRVMLAGLGAAEAEHVLLPT